MRVSGCTSATRSEPASTHAYIPSSSQYNIVCIVSRVLPSRPELKRMCLCGQALPSQSPLLRTGCMSDKASLTRVISCAAPHQVGKQPSRQMLTCAANGLVTDCQRHDATLSANSLHLCTCRRVGWLGWCTAKKLDTIDDMLTNNAHTIALSMCQDKVPLIAETIAAALLVDTWSRTDSA
jgi:hypothetical protein